MPPVRPTNRCPDDFYTLTIPRRTACTRAALAEPARCVKNGGMSVLKIGVLGSDAGVTGLVAAAAARGDVILVAADAVPPGNAIPSDAGVTGRRVPWETLLDAASCDAVAVGADGWNESRAEAVRTLVQAGRTLVLSQPLELSMLWAFELDMIRRDSGAVLIPFLPDRLHPFTARLREAIEAGVSGASPLGPLESVRFDRTMTDRTRASVLAALSRDIDLIRVLVGEPSRLATLGAGDPDSAWATLAVGFTGAEQVPVRWQVGPGGPQGLSIALQHATGTVHVLSPDAKGAPWTWSGPPVEQGPFDRGGAMLDLLHDSVRRKAAPTTADTIPPATWADAARAIEFAETVPRSLARGRAIDLHREEFSEIGTFRGTMASLGCAIVLAGLLVLILATLIGGIASEFDWELGKSIAAAWPVLVLVVLGLFLALQLLPLLIGPDRAGPREDLESGSPKDDPFKAGNRR